MRHTSLAWLLIGGTVVALISCGDGGGTGLPPGTFGTDNGPYSSDTESPASWTEMPSSFNEAPCGLDETLKFSEFLLDVAVPYCNFEANCSDAYTRVSGEPISGGSNRQASMFFGNVPSFCQELAMTSAGPDGVQGMCGFEEALGNVARGTPGCEQTILLPRGLCKASYVDCMRDIISYGCGGLNTNQVPSSCVGLDDLTGGESDVPDPRNEPGSPPND